MELANLSTNHGSLICQLREMFNKQGSLSRNVCVNQAFCFSSHPTYSPDLAPLDFHLSAPLKLPNQR
jgi:hypothetical protein